MGNRDARFIELGMRGLLAALSPIVNALFCLAPSHWTLDIIESA